MDEHKERIIEVRSTVFDAAVGISLDEAMQGISMAIGHMIAQTTNDPQMACQIATHYHQILLDALPIYCAEADAGYVMT